MQLKGIIKLIGETKTFGNNGFTKREVVIETEEQYKQKILIEFTKDKCDLVNNFTVGENVTIDINVLGREWVNPQGESKYFNAIQGWRIERQQFSGAQDQEQQPEKEYPNEPEQPPENEKYNDDLPF